MKMDIYLIQCMETNNKYIGQCKHYLSSGERWGYKKRFKHHIISSLNGSSKSTKLKNSILKYGENMHTLKRLVICNEIDADIIETGFICYIFNSLHPNGLNLESGGNKYKMLSDETKLKMSKIRMGHPNYLKPDSPKKISKGLKRYWDNNPSNRHDHNNDLLPKYISPVLKDNLIIGYCAHIHHNKKRKKITSNGLSNDEKLFQIKQFLNKEQ